MHLPRLISSFIVCFTVIIAAAVAHVDAASFVITPIPDQVQGTIAPEFAGLSYESSILLTGPDQAHYFSLRNAPLIDLFKTLGVRSLRVGGDGVDSPRFAIPGDADIDSLFQFARAAGVKVIYSFRFKNGNVETTLPLARYIADHYSENLECFAIGNEPNVYYKSFAEYLPVWSKYFAAITVGNPSVKVCGPSAWQEDWARQFADAMTPEQLGKIAFVSQHIYPFGVADRLKDAAAACEQMIGKKDYNANYQKFAPEVLKRGLRYRLEETNSYAHGGEEGASNAYVAALWALDYCYWWASHQASGINFHTGNFSVSANRRGFRYSAFVPSANGYTSLPLAYGMLTFSLGGQGRLVNVKVERPTAGTVPDLRVYAVRDEQGDIRVTLINRSRGREAGDAHISMNLPKAFNRVASIALAQADGDLAAQTEITVGGAAIEDDGEWKGKWTELHSANQLSLAVPAASAMVVKLSD